MMLAVDIDQNEVVPARCNFRECFLVRLRGVDVIASHTKDLVAYRSEYVARANVKYAELLRVGAVAAILIFQHDLNL